MDIVERKGGDRRRLARLISKESDAMQRDRLRSVLLVLQGRQALEVADVVGRSRRFVQRWAYAYRDGGIEAVRGRTAPGRQRRLSPEQEARFVERVKAGATPRDGVASLRGPRIRGILDREFGKTFSLNGIYKLLNRHGLFHDASTSALGVLGTPTTGIPARVSYAANYYDAADRLTASVNVGTNGGLAYVRPATAPARSDTALVTTFSHDTAGRVQDVTDPNGITARTLYDDLGRTTATIANFTGAAPGAQTDVTTLFSFDSSGRLASRTAVQAVGTPSQTTDYVYGVSATTGSTIASNDIMAETRYPDASTGLPSATDRDIYTSNALGERTSFTDRAGTTQRRRWFLAGPMRRGGRWLTSTTTYSRSSLRSRA